MGLTPYRDASPVPTLPVDEAFGATVDGDVEAFWRRVQAHPLVRASDRRSPYPPPPRGNPLLATRDGDTITIRYWRPRASRERYRLELRATPSQVPGRTRVEVTVRSWRAGLSAWRQRDELVEDIATYGVYAVTAGVVGVSLVAVGALLWVWVLIGVVAFPLLVLRELAGGSLVESASGRAHDRQLNPGWSVPSLTIRGEGTPTAAEDHRPNTGMARRGPATLGPLEAFERLLADLELR